MAMRFGPLRDSAARARTADPEPEIAMRGAGAARDARAQLRLSLLSKLGALAGSLDDEQALSAIARLSIPEQMMGILAHDLRNPLSAVRGITALLLRRDDLPESAREALAEIGRAGKRMLEMIGTLLDFTESRFHGGLPIVRAPTDLHAVCRGVVDELLAGDPGREIELELLGDGRGMWDAARMAQVVSNLAGNAFKHGAKDAPVRISVHPDGDRVVLAVANRGPAIAPELLPTLFEPFRHGRSERDASHARGLGLGLYIVRQVVDAHGGAVEVESTAEYGTTTFTVRLPRAGARPVSSPKDPPEQLLEG